MTTVVTTRIDDGTLAKLDDLCGQVRRSRAWVVAQAIERYVDEELAHRAFIQEGIDAADRGDVLTQEQMEAWFEARYGSAAAAE